LTKVHLPDGLANELWNWKTECKEPSSKKAAPEAFNFPNADGGFLHANTYRYRVLGPLAKKLGIEWLNFQILRRTMATQAQSMGRSRTSRRTCGIRGPTRRLTSTCRRCPKVFKRWSARFTKC